MTHEEAKMLTTFKHSCTCGGYAWSMNNRPQSNPHMDWCPQKPQYDEWWAALNPAPNNEANRRRPARLG